MKRLQKTKNFYRTYLNFAETEKIVQNKMPFRKIQKSNGYCYHYLITVVGCMQERDTELRDFVLI